MDCLSPRSQVLIFVDNFYPRVYVFWTQGFDCFSHPRVMYFEDNFTPGYIFWTQGLIAFHTPGYYILLFFFTPGYVFGPRVFDCFSHFRVSDIFFTSGWVWIRRFCRRKKRFPCINDIANPKKFRAFGAKNNP